MNAIHSLAFYLAAGIFTWAFVEISDRRKLNKPGLSYSEYLRLQEERIPVWGWIGGLVFFLILFVLVPFVGFAADLT
ncbi:hypothetical protein W822_20115 [Advenella kashmirensis W13003]|uniref:Uncharacterized protein n=1 Tax=Advenella kashmirensis W13003 TaxID=1424334 RepID=V8QPM5_9BURK|nr:hypothetical protein [Advenella kashmirensis]ETF00949.1 hypothetical protein W822_20115 [Advenella kashmirensis W13003]